MTEKEMIETGVLEENIKAIKDMMDGSVVPLLSTNENEISIMIKDKKTEFDVIEDGAEIKFGINQYLFSTGFSETAVIFLVFSIGEYKNFTFFFPSIKGHQEVLKRFMNATNLIFTLNHENKDNELEANFINISIEESDIPFKIISHMPDTKETIDFVKKKLLLEFSKESIYNLVFDTNFHTNTLFDLEETS